MKPELRPEVGVAAGSWVMVGEHRALQCLDADWLLSPVPCSTVPAVAAGVQTGNVARGVCRDRQEPPQPLLMLASGLTNQLEVKSL